MSLVQAIILAVVQGVTEFLPVSSSGHLNLFQHLFKLTPSLTFDIFLNTATLLSVIFFFRHQVGYFKKNIPYILVGSIPAVVVGFLFKDRFDLIFADIKLLPLFFLITAIFLLITKYLPTKSAKLNYKNAFIIGLFQALAILPAVSRSGATIFTGLLVGLTSVEAFNFSFSLFIPASIGALILSLKDLSTQNIFTTSNLLSFGVTFIVGVFALIVLKKILLSNKLWFFGVYVLMLSIILLLLSYT